MSEDLLLLDFVIADQKANILAEFCAAKKKISTIQHDQQKIVKLTKTYNMNPLERKKVFSKKSGNWLIQKGAKQNFYYILCTHETCPERLGHKAILEAIEQFEDLNISDRSSWNQQLGDLLKEQEDLVKKDNIVQATTKVDLAKDKMQESLEQAMKNNADLNRVDDKTNQLLEMAKDFAEDADELKDYMERRNRALKVTFIAGVVGGGGMAVTAILQGILHFAGMGLIPI